MKRIFLAADIHPDASFNKELELIRRQLAGGYIKWINPQQMHLTIRFLGDTDESDIAMISAAVKESTAGVKAFDMSFSSLGVFKNISQPRIIWIGCHHPVQMKNLKEGIDMALNQCDIQPEGKDFSPHLTIGRIKVPPSKGKLSELIDGYKGFAFYTQHVSQIVLYESILLAKGPEYIPIQVFELKGE